MDVHTREQRSFNMSKIGPRDTKPELVVRQWLWRHGHRYRVHYRDLPGKPDIVFPGRRKVIFVHGCFWHMHRCRYFKWPSSNADFWKQKIESNALRDLVNYEKLVASGWTYLILWECVLREPKSADKQTKLEQIGRLIEQFLASKNKLCMEIDLNGLHLHSVSEPAAAINTP